MIKEKLDGINNSMTLLKGRKMVYSWGIFPLPNQSTALAELK